MRNSFQVRESYSKLIRIMLSNIKYTYEFDYWGLYNHVLDMPLFLKWIDR